VPGAPFDADYLALQPRDSEAVRWEREMVARSDLSPQFAIFLAQDAAAALALTERLLGEETVGEVHSLVELEDLEREGYEIPIDLRRSLETLDGSYAVYAYPEHDVWDEQQRDLFLARMRGIDPKVTGMPFLGDYMVARSLRAALIGGTLGSALLILCVVARFRRLRPSLLVLLPTALTAGVLPVLMRLLGVSWNPLDIMALPVVLGIAVDDGIHLVHRFDAERGDLGGTLAGSGRSVVLTSATTLAAFGALTFAHHRGLASFAQVLSLGVMVSLAFSLLVLPAALARFGTATRGLEVAAAESSAHTLAAPAPEPGQPSPVGPRSALSRTP
jgi:hypothetical protein